MSTQGLVITELGWALIADRGNGRVCELCLDSRELRTLCGVGGGQRTPAEIEHDAVNMHRSVSTAGLPIVHVSASASSSSAAAAHAEEDDESARLFAPSAVALDPTAPDCLLIACDDAQKVLRRRTPDGRIRIVAGNPLPMPAPEDEEDHVAMAMWVRKCLEQSSFGRAAEFSDIAGMCVGRLNDQAEDLVYMACMHSNCVRSYNPRTHEVKMVVRLNL